MKLSNWKVLQTLLNGKTNLSDREFRLAVTILSHRNESTLDCSPSQKRLSSITHIPQQSISYTVAKLKKKGVLQTIRKANPLTHPFKQVNQYFFMLDLQDAIKISLNPNFKGCPDDVLLVTEKAATRAILDHPKSKSLV